ncbi:MAG: methyltransferase [Gammaproteobacteria bacterium]
MSEQDKYSDDLDPMAVMRVASAYWNSSILHAANSVNLFTRLANGPMTADEMAAAVGCDTRGIEMILMGCVCLGFLEKKDGRFSNTATASTFLVDGSPRNQRGIVSMFKDWVLPWSNLDQAVKTGQPVVEKQHDHGEEATRTYITGMLHRGIPQAQLLAEEVPLSGRKRMLDVGGGPGIFSIIMCQKNPELKADVFDLPQTLRVTRDIIKDWQAEDRVSTVEGSYLDSGYGSGYDVVLTSSMISQEGDEVVKHILQESFNAMESGGLLMVQEQFLNDEKSGPMLPVQVGLNQLIHTPAGRAYSAQEVAEFAREIGFIDISYRPLPEPSPFTLITATKP